MPAYLTPPGTFAKKDTISRMSASSGITIIPLMPCTMNPAMPVNERFSSSNAALSNTPPSSTQIARPATANAIIAAWTTTSSAIR